MDACLSPCEDNLRPFEAPRGVPSEVPHAQSCAPSKSEVPSVVPSEAIHVQSYAPSQWQKAAPFAVLPIVLFEAPIPPGVLIEAPPSEVPMGVPSDVLNVQSCAPAEGASKVSSSSVPPGVLPVQSCAPSEGASKVPSSVPSEVLHVQFSAPS
jgi:hypothetical protein